MSADIFDHMQERIKELQAELNAVCTSENKLSLRCKELEAEVERLNEAARTREAITRDAKYDNERIKLFNDEILKDRDQLHEHLRIAQEALDWYWMHWNTSDENFLAEGYNVAKEALAKIKQE